MKVFRNTHSHNRHAVLARTGSLSESKAKLSDFVNFALDWQDDWLMNLELFKFWTNLLDPTEFDTFLN